jgi:cysteine-rich repeat protein
MCKNAVCGDGLVQANVEQCDDGANNGNNKACKANCSKNICGDGFVGPGEACDDGNQSNDDACTNVCKTAACGDGFKQPGEACDAGVNNNNNGGVCTLSCTLPKCGDGFVQPGETCDDKNLSNNDACLNTCQLAKCGDGIVYQGVEQCDDGNAVNNDLCSNLCVTATCSDGVKNAAETDVDCGGACGKCAINKACNVNADCNQGLCNNKICALPKTCNELKVAQPGTPTGNYNIDPDGGGAIPALQVHCEMAVDVCGYTMVRFNDANLGSNQDLYASKCSAAGMEVIVARTKAHATSIYTWNGNVTPNLYNVFPKYNGAQNIFNWTAKCKGVDCSFWMTDNANGDVSCGGFEPNGDNNTAYRIYKWNEGCGVQGGWNDANNTMTYTGWVICSTNDC